MPVTPKETKAIIFGLSNRNGILHLSIHQDHASEYRCKSLGRAAKSMMHEPKRSEEGPHEIAT